MNKTCLWQAAEFPHFYYNPAVVEPLEFALKQAIKRLDKMLKKQNAPYLVQRLSNMLPSMRL